MPRRDCPLCGEELEDNASLHDKIKCEKTELLKGRKTIIKLSKLVNDWKDAWYQLRDIIGRLWWEHPAIDSDKERAYYLSKLRTSKELAITIPKENV